MMDKRDILHWLAETDSSRLDQLWSAADRTRKEHVGDSVHLRGLVEISKDLMELSAKARAGELKGPDMQGATFTISSLGGIGGTSFTPIVNAPEVAILGLTRSKMAPVWNGEEFVPRLMQPLSLSYDHRAIDGALAARFCVTLKTLLGDMRKLMW